MAMLADHDIDRRHELPPVFGRVAELQRVDAFLDRLGDGPAGLLLRGEAGIGKTTIWSQAVQRAKEHGCTVMRCRPGSADQGLPYGGLGDLFAGTPEALIDELPHPQRRALRTALLRLDAGSEPLEQRAVAVAVLQTLENLADAAPMVMAIDDLQWLDAPSRRVLRFVVRRLSSSRTGLVVAVRHGATDDDPLDMVDAFGADKVDTVPVGPLPLTELDHVLRVRLGTAFLGSTLRRIADAAGGNPLFAVELGRALLESDLSHLPGQWLPAPASLADLLASRLAKVPPPVHRALLACAAMAQPTIGTVIEATASDDLDTVALRAAVDAGVITMRGPDIRFTHPLFASVLYSSASDGERRDLHRRLAAVVAEPEEHARHLGLSVAEPDEAIAATIEGAALQAASRGAPEVAALLFEQAADLTPGPFPPQGIRRRLEAADLHIAAGDLASARAILEPFIKPSIASSLQAVALHRLARITVFEGENLSAVPELLRLALAEVGTDAPLRAAIERDLIWALAQIGEVQDLLDLGRSALSLAEAGGDPRLVSEALDHLCMAQFLTGHTIDRDLLDRALRSGNASGGLRRPRHAGIATRRLPLALTLKWIDDLGPARDLLHAIRAEQAALGNEAALPHVLFHLGELEWWSGDWDAAAACSRDSHELAARTDQAVAERRAVTLDVMVAATRGDAELVRLTGPGLLARSEEARDWPAAVRVLHALGAVELSLGRPDGAARHLERGVAIEARAGFGPSVVRIAPDAIEAMLAAGRHGDAEAIFEGLERCAARLSGPWATATAARCRGLIEAATGDLTQAEMSLKQGLDPDLLRGLPYEGARTLLALGVVQRRAKSRRAARESLDGAQAIFERLGATAWSERTRAERSRIAGRAASRYQLTATEEQVADLVGAGHTNSEIAGLLSISIKTVESNLTRIYRKLGVTSRRELGRTANTQG